MRERRGHELPDTGEPIRAGRPEEPSADEVGRGDRTAGRGRMPAEPLREPTGRFHQR